MAIDSQLHYNSLRTYCKLALINNLFYETFLFNGWRDILVCAIKTLNYLMGDNFNRID